MMRPNLLTLQLQELSQSVQLHRLGLRCQELEKEILRLEESNQQLEDQLVASGRTPSVAASTSSYPNYRRGGVRSIQPNKPKISVQPILPG